MTPTVVCHVFNDLYAMPPSDLLTFRMRAMVEWGRHTDDPVCELIALQADYVAMRRGLIPLPDET